MTSTSWEQFAIAFVAFTAASVCAGLGDHEVAMVIAAGAVGYMSKSAPSNT